MAKKRKVTIEERRQRGFDSVPAEQLGPVRRVDRDAPITIPTGDRRHASVVREGRISGEVFSRARRASIPVDPIVREGGRKADNADQELQEGSAESVPSDDEAVRPEEGTTGVLRDGKQTRSRKKPDSKGEQRVPKEEVNSKAAKQRKKKASMTKRERKYGKAKGT